MLGGVDFDADAVETFRRNHTAARVVCADLSTLRPNDLASELDLKAGTIDCMVGGPPCQGFSRNRAFRHQGGEFIDDPRNHLYKRFFDFVDHLRPKTVVIENVPEILVKNKGFFGTTVKARFHRLGYSAESKVLNAAHFGVPQRRRRAIFLAGRDNAQLDFPEPTHRLGPRPGRRTPQSKLILEPEQTDLYPALATSPTVWDAIGDLHGAYAETLDGDSRYAKPPQSDYQVSRRASATRVSNHFPWPLTERQLARVRLLREGEGHAHLPDHLRVKNGYGSAYRRMQANAQALTLTTWLFHPGSGMFTHPKDDRIVTIREAARLQSFQDSFGFTGRYHSQCRQLGNSVAPLVARAIALSVRSALGIKPNQ